MSDDEAYRETRKGVRGYLRELRESSHAIRWIWQEVITQDSKRRARRMLGFQGVMSAVDTASPFFIGLAVTALAVKDANSALWYLALTGAFFIIHKLLAWRMMVEREWIVGDNMGRLDGRVSELVFEKSLGQLASEQSTLSAGALEKGRSRVLELSELMLFQGIDALVTLVVSWLALLIISPVTWGIMTFAISASILWMLLLNQQVVKVCVPIEKDFRALNRYRHERWERPERVKTNGKDDEEKRLMNGRFRGIITRDRRFWIWFIGHITLRDLIMAIAAIISIGWGAHLILEGAWEVGLMVPLSMWTIRLVENIWQIGQLEHRINWNLPSVIAMIRGLEIPPEEVEAPGASALQGETPIGIIFERVSFAYRDADAPEMPEVLRNFSLEVRPGERVAIIGESGAGKTTLMKLLLRYTNPTEGVIFAGGNPLRSITRDSWGRLVGYIPQEPQILDGTLRYNLLYGLSADEQARITDEDLWALVRRLKIDFGERLTEGLETKLGTYGIKLSGGQKQRVMIGSAVIKHPRLMVIDEATSNLDSTTEKQVQDGLREALRDDVTALIIAHRLSTVRQLCTRFIVLRPASEVAVGESQIEAAASSFEELHALSPIFRRLCEDQDLRVGT